MPSNPSKLDPLDWCPKEDWSNSIPGLSTSFLPSTHPSSLSGPSPHWQESREGSPSLFTGPAGLTATSLQGAHCYLLAGAIVPPLLALGPPHPFPSLAHSRAHFGFFGTELIVGAGRARSSILKWTDIPTAPISPLTSRALEIGASKGMCEGQTATPSKARLEPSVPQSWAQQSTRGPYLERDVWPGPWQVPLATPSWLAKARSEGWERMGAFTQIHSQRTAAQFRRTEMSARGSYALPRTQP